MMLDYVDSSVWIARFEGLLPYRQKIDNQLMQLAEQGFSFCVSDVVLLEVLIKPIQVSNTKAIETYRHVFRQTQLVPIYEKVFADALDIAKKEGLKSMDAIHVALALQNQCKYFISTDSHFKNLKSLPTVWINLTSN